jgi:hypothetical protein
VVASPASELDKDPPAYEPPPAYEQPPTYQPEPELEPGPGIEGPGPEGPLHLEELNDDEHRRVLVRLPGPAPAALARCSKFWRGQVADELLWEAMVRPWGGRGGGRGGEGLPSATWVSSAHRLLCSGVFHGGRGGRLPAGLPRHEQWREGLGQGALPSSEPSYRTRASFGAGVQGCCLEATDTYNIWSIARVLLTLDDYRFLLPPPPAPPTPPPSSSPSPACTHLAHRGADACPGGAGALHPARARQRAGLPAERGGRVVRGRQVGRRRPPGRRARAARLGGAEGPPRAPEPRLAEPLHPRPPDPRRRRWRRRRRRTGARSRSACGSRPWTGSTAASPPPQRSRRSTPQRARPR